MSYSLLLEKKKELKAYGAAEQMSAFRESDSRCEKWKERDESETDKCVAPRPHSA